MRYGWTGWFDGESDCSPPEPGKRWLEIQELDDDGSQVEEIAVIVHRGTRRVIPCTCGVRSMRPEDHKFGCPRRGSLTAPIYDWDDKTREQKEAWAQEIVDLLNQ